MAWVRPKVASVLQLSAESVAELLTDQTSGLIGLSQNGALPTGSSPLAGVDQRAVGLRPHVELAFARERVSIDFAGFSGETLAGALQEPLDMIRIGRLTPDEISLRVLLPDLTVPVGLPALASTGADDPRVRMRSQEIAGRFNQMIVDSLRELADLQLVRSVSAQVRVYRATPVFKLYILNDEDVFFGFYPVLEHQVLIEKEPVAVYDPMGKDAVLFHFSATGGEVSTGARYVAEARKWFDSIWNSVTQPAAT